MIPITWKTAKKYIPNPGRDTSYRELHKLLKPNWPYPETLLTMMGGVKLAAIRQGMTMKLFVFPYTRDGSDIPKGLQLRLLLENAR